MKVTLLSILLILDPISYYQHNSKKQTYTIWDNWIKRKKNEMKKTEKKSKRQIQRHIDNCLTI